MEDLITASREVLLDMAEEQSFVRQEFSKNVYRVCSCLPKLLDYDKSPTLCSLGETDVKTFLTSDYMCSLQFATRRQTCAPCGAAARAAATRAFADAHAASGGRRSAAWPAAFADAHAARMCRGAQKDFAWNDEMVDISDCEE